MVYGETNDEYLARKLRWHRWFAWRPVTLKDGRHVWLQVIERRFYTPHSIVQAMLFCPPLFTEYRLPEAK